MATPARRCTECGTSLAGKSATALTCSPAHRAQRARRIHRDEEHARKREVRGSPASGPITDPATAEIIHTINERQTEVLRETFAEELRPIIREAIDEDAIRAIKGMVGLAPAAILVLQQDLTSTDAVLRSKAAALVIKYTLGNQLVTPGREDDKPGLTIINNLPDAPVPTIDVEPIVDAETVEPDPLLEVETLPAGVAELRRCDTCNLPKPLSAFPADGPRCAQCLAERKASAMERLNEQYAVPAPLKETAPAPPPTPPKAQPAPAFAGPHDPKRWGTGTLR